MAEQKSPPGIIYRPLYEEETGTFPNIKMRFTPRLCNQCDNPPCVEACPNKGEGKATWKSASGASAGIVLINYEQCIGCGRCVVACPYKARALDAGIFYTEDTPETQAYEQAPTWEYRKKWPRQKDHLPIGNARKCHFCYHRLSNGLVPMCVSTCPCRANFFGDTDDKESLIHKMISQHKVKVLRLVKGNEESGLTLSDLKGMAPADISRMIGYPGAKPVFAESAQTKPRVYYIMP
jgi:molybdopterin-containing oxidoreductase family iron-sulfur binding subunit